MRKVPKLMRFTIREINKKKNQKKADLTALAQFVADAEQTVQEQEPVQQHREVVVPPESRSA